MWCHLLLGMPLIGLVLFIVFPLWMALPAYMFITLASLALYRIVWRSMKLKPVTGMEALIGAPARAVTDVSSEGWVKCGGETWRATSSHRIRRDSPVRILAYEGMRVRVELEERDAKGWRSAA